MKPLVTICIPTHNSKRIGYLREAVTTALAQTYVPLEVLISDDGQAEENYAYGTAMAAKDVRVRYRRNPRNRGLAGNWNELVAAAHGEWVLIIGDDDRFLPECVEKLVELIQPDLSVVFSNHYLIDQHGQRLETASLKHTERYHRDALVPGRLALAEAMVWRNAIPLCSALVRTAAARRLRFKEDLNCPEIELFVRLVREGTGFVFRPDYLMEYRTHPHSATTTGLWAERLADYLLPIEASPEVEPYKREFMSSLLVEAVTRCYHLGDGPRARKYLDNAYYPASGPRWGIRTVQRFCSLLPGGLDCRLFGWMYRHKGLVATRPSEVTS